MILFALRKKLDVVIHPIVSGMASLPIHANTFTLIGAILPALMAPRVRGAMI